MTTTPDQTAPRLPPSERVALAYRQIAVAGRPEVWIHLRDEHDALVDADGVERRIAAGERLPLAGTTLAVKDNIDVAGLPTTAGCPSFAYTPALDAPCVALMRAAGTVVLGKTNLDQFATGLVGTRSPFGAVRDARDPRRVSGGSSAGSAVAVALGIADLALGTDTAGSGRVPAAFQGVIGLKPTRGLVSTRGVVPACRTFDCVSVLARTLPEAQVALSTIATPDPQDPGSRPWPFDAPLGLPRPPPRVASAAPSELASLSADVRRALSETLDRLRASGGEVVQVDIEPLLSTGALLYDGAFVAERFAAVGSFIAAHLGDVDPTVAEIILAAGSITAADYVADSERLAAHRVSATETLRGFDALLLPTAPFQPTIREVVLDPIEINRRLGTYTTFCNLLDMCAVAFPAGEADGGQFGVTLFAPAFHDRALADLAATLTGDEPGRAEFGSLTEPEALRTAHARVNAGRVSPPPRQDRRAPLVARFVHSSLAVADLDQSVAFYCAAFGAEVVFSDPDMTDLIDRTVGIRGVRAGLAQLRFPGAEHMLELIAFRDVPDGRLDSAPMRVGHGHVCFTVDDLEHAIGDVERLGATRVGEVVLFPDECRAIYMREPAGSVFELEELV